MPFLPFQIITITADLIIFIFIGYYLWSLRAKEKVLEEKENKIDTDFHQVIDNALAKERKILEDATNKADNIIANAQYFNQASKQTVDLALKNMVIEIQNTSRVSKETVDNALKTMIIDIQKEALGAAHDFMNSYSVTLKQLSLQSLNNFQNITKELETDLQNQIANFHESLLPNMEKELDEYKKLRLKQAEQIILHVVQNASQEILNKSISINDHENLMIEAMEKAKKEGVFD